MVEKNPSSGREKMMTKTMVGLENRKTIGKWWFNGI